MNTGKVYLVGAGPGDPDYLTVKASRLIQQADVVMYDTLTGDGVLDLIPESTEGIYVGKRPPGGGARRISQRHINRLMVTKARQGKLVVRLKGGDPNVFGRGGEEALYLAEAGIPFEIVPGVSSILGAPGIAGIPLTHRNLASSFTVITGHENPNKPESALNWKALANNVLSGGTLVILMGVKRLEENVEALLRQDVPGDTPMAVIQKATLPEQVILTATLDTMVEQVRTANISPPALFVLGDVVRVREHIIRSSRVDLPATGGSLPEHQNRTPASLEELSWGARRGH